MDKNETKRMTLAQIWDEADPKAASNMPSKGEHEARLNSLILDRNPKKGIAVKAQYEIIDGEEEGKKISQLYKLSDADGGKAQGADFLARDLALIGYDNISGKKLEKTLKDITDEQPMVIIRVAENGVYTNAYLQGLAGESKDKDDDDAKDDDEIEVGDNVTGTNDDGDDIEGEVTKIKKGKATVKDDNDDEHVIAVEDLTKEEEEEEEEEEEKLKKGKKDEEEEEEEEEEEPKKKKGKKEEEEEEDDDIEVGDRVKFDDDDGDEVIGEVTKVKGDTLYVKDDDDDTHKVDVADAEKVEEEEEEEEKPKKKKK